MSTWLDLFTAFNGRVDADDHAEQFGAFSFEAQHPIAALDHHWLTAQADCARDGLQAPAARLFNAMLSAFFEHPKSCLAFQVGRRVLEREALQPRHRLTIDRSGDESIVYLDFPDGALTILGDMKVSAIFILRRLSFHDVPGEPDLVCAPPRIFAVVGPSSVAGTHVLTWSHHSRAWELFCTSVVMMGNAKIDAREMNDLVQPRASQIIAEIELALQRVLDFAERYRPERDWSAIGQIASDAFEDAALAGRPIFDASLFRVLRLGA